MITGNARLSQQSIESDILNQEHIPQMYKDYVSQNPDLYLQTSSEFLLLIINGEMQLGGNTQFIGQKSVISSMNSILSVNNISVSDTQSGHYIFNLIDSDVTINELTMQNITHNPQLGDKIFSIAESRLIISNSVFSHLEVPILLSAFSIVEWKNISISFVNTQRSIFTSWVTKIPNFEDVDVKEITTNATIFSIIESSIEIMKHVSVSDILTTAFELIDSEAVLIDSIKLSNLTRCMKITESTITEIKASKFNFCGSSTVIEGGALLLERSNVTIKNSTFLNNKAKKGGAVSIKCKIGTLCDTIVSDSHFEGNVGSIQGGAINYNYNPPKIRNLTNISNIAPYGPDIASYATNIIFDNTNSSFMTIDQIGSGRPIDKVINLRIIDHENQTLTQLNEGVIKISSSLDFLGNTPATNSSVLGFDSEKIVNGTVRFQNIALIGASGSKGLKYFFYSPIIKYSTIFKLGNVDPEDYSAAVTHISTEFRYCKPGEIIHDSHSHLNGTQPSEATEWKMPNVMEKLKSKWKKGSGEAALIPPL